MSETESRDGSSSQEVVVRVVVEQPPTGVRLEDTHSSNTTLADLAKVVLRLTELTERLAVVDEHDQVVVRRIETFDERIKLLEEKIAAIEEQLNKPATLAETTLSNMTIEDFEALERRLEGRLTILLEDALAKTAFTATGSIDKPPITRTRTPGLTAEAPEPSSLAAEQKQSNDNTPDYMVANEKLSPHASRAERILLFLLNQSGQRYTSPRDTAGKDIREILEIDDKPGFGNTLGRLKEDGFVWDKKKNVKRTKALGINERAFDTSRYYEFITKRVQEKLAQTDFSEATLVAEGAENGEAVIDVTDLQKDIILVVGEEAALIVPDFTEAMSDRFSNDPALYVKAVAELIIRGFIRKLKYGKLEEYSLTPPGRAYYEQLVEKNKEPPFLAVTQAS